MERTITVDNEQFIVRDTDKEGVLEVAGAGQVGRVCWNSHLDQYIGRLGSQATFSGDLGEVIRETAKILIRSRRPTQEDIREDMDEFLQGG